MTRQFIEDTESTAKSMAEKSQQQRQISLSVLVDSVWDENKVLELWQYYDDDYFLRHSVDEIIRQTEQRLKQPNVATLIKTRNYDDDGTIEIFILTKDKRGIFSAITVALDHLQLNILDAKINTTSNGELLNTFIVNGPERDTNEIVNEIYNGLDNLNKIDVSTVYTPRIMTLFRTAPVINYQNSVQDKYTILELYTNDRPGLISTVAQVFIDCKIHLLNAKLVTLGDQVEDVFFITTIDHKALSSRHKLQIKEALVGAFTEIDLLQ
jgi:[protein-PII] uridylyltransferase